MRKTLKWPLKTSKGKERKGKLKRDRRPSFSKPGSKLLTLITKYTRARREHGLLVVRQEGKEFVIIEEQMIKRTPHKRRREETKC